jgi:hypothetical protein
MLSESVEVGKAAGITDIDVLEVIDYYKTSRGPIVWCYKRGILTFRYWNGLRCLLSRRNIVDVTDFDSDR